jgi:hypothetical protein
MRDVYKQHVYVLEFHVDYWDRLGWKDLFSNKAYTQRQQQYVNVFHLSSAYTPQAIVNGKNELVGSDRPQLRSLIEDGLRKKPLNELYLSATVNGSALLVQYSVSDAKDQVLNVALVQKKTETSVKRGENAGRRLPHMNVVRDIKTINPGSGKVSIALPPGLQANDCNIIAFTQDKNTWEVTGVAEAGIN